MRLSPTQRLTRIALLAALALVLGYLESMVPIPVSIPGVRLGLGNVCVLLALYLLDTRSALAVMVLKVSVSALLFGSPMALIYSAAGGLLSFGGMWLLRRWDKVNIIAVSIVAAVLHNIAQVLVATALLATPAILLNLPILAVVACVTGALTGTVAAQVIRALGASRR
ncbi:MAG: Gx transporter family protein [Coriobacteriales bacterium]|jgi:heptaprenyl diphosphate synthase|nr:Gx transporter family protein [Coriobacteriales bacterium]